MLIKIHQSYRNMISICDSDLLGKRFEEGIRVLDIRDNFYDGEEHDEKSTIKIMKDYTAEDATFCIVGKESTQTALKAGMISKEGIMKVQGIPFALTLTIKLYKQIFS